MFVPCFIFIYHFLCFFVLAPLHFLTGSLHRLDGMFRGDIESNKRKTKQQIAAEKKASLASELLNNRHAIVRFTGGLLVCLGGSTILLGLLVFGFAVSHWDSGCDTPLKWFLLLFGMTFTGQGILLALQFMLPYEEKLMRKIVLYSYLPAVLEVVLLVLGSVWSMGAEHCNDLILRTSQVIIVIAWILIAVGVVQKIYRRFVQKPTPVQHWQS
jgi:hypothetical protein